MTCGHCVSSVTEELTAIGADGVAVDLAKGGVSTVTLTAPGVLPEAEIRDAVREAVYEPVSVAEIN